MSQRKRKVQKIKEEMAESTTVSMKLLIDTKEKRVLFAEASKDCVDFLFHILSLPVATVIRLLEAHEGMEGSWPNLYKSLENLDDTYIHDTKKRENVLKPAPPPLSAAVLLLTLGDASPVGKKFYSCNQCYVGYVTDDPRTICPKHRVVMSSKLVYVAPPPVNGAAEGGGLVEGVVTYMVMDDLEVKPMSTIYSLALLNTFKVKDVSALEERDVKLGLDEALKVLKASHRSKTVLIDVFLTNLEQIL